MRAEAAAYRVEARNEREARERAEAAAETARREADQRVQAAETAAAERTNKFKARTIDGELRAAAASAGLSDLDLIHLPAFDRAGITCDDDGNVVGAAEAVARFKEKKPNYFGSPAPPAPPRRTGDPAPPPAPGGPPAPTNVRQAEKPAYDKAKAAALAALR